MSNSDKPSKILNLNTENLRSTAQSSKHPYYGAGSGRYVTELLKLAIVPGRSGFQPFEYMPSKDGISVHSAKIKIKEGLRWLCENLPRNTPEERTQVAVYESVRDNIVLLTVDHINLRCEFRVVADARARGFRVLGLAGIINEIDAFVKLANTPGESFELNKLNLSPDEIRELRTHTASLDSRNFLTSIQPTRVLVVYNPRRDDE